MAFAEHMDTFGGLPVRALSYPALPGAAEGEGVALRVGLQGDEAWDDEDDAEERFVAWLARVLASPEVARLKGLLLGPWAADMDRRSPDAAVEALVGAARRLGGLEALFVGDVPRDSAELSWIAQTELGPLVMALPRLRVFGVRGGMGLRLSGLRHKGLRELVIQTGGLSGECVRGLMGASLPELRRLELWLGTAEYERTAEVQDLAPLLSGKLFPRLTHLGLVNCDLADAIAAAVATSPALARLEVLDLSMGTLGDAGAAALLANPATQRLKRLDLRESYLSEAMIARLGAELPGVEVLIRPAKDEIDRWYNPEHRYVSHGE